MVKDLLVVWCWPVFWRRWNESMSQIWNLGGLVRGLQLQSGVWGQTTLPPGLTLTGHRSLLTISCYCLPATIFKCRSPLASMEARPADKVVWNPSVTSSLLGLLDTLFFMVKSHFRSPGTNLHVEKHCIHCFVVPVLMAKLLQAMEWLSQLQALLCSSCD